MPKIASKKNLSLHKGEDANKRYPVVAEVVRQLKANETSFVASAGNGQEDITEIKKAEDELQKRLLQQAVVTDLGIKALSGMALRSLMNEAVIMLKDVLKVEYTKVLELLPNGKKVILRAGAGWNKDIIVDISTVDVGKNSQAGYTLLSKTPIIVKDLPNEKRFTGPPLLRNHGVLSGMSCIIYGKDKPYGVLGIHTTKHREFTKYDVNFLQAMANVLAAAIQRKNDEENREESGALFRQLAETIPHIVYQFNRKGSIEYMNKKWFEYTGASQSDPNTLESYYSYIHPDDLLKVIPIWKQARKKGESYEVEYRLKRHDGIYRWHISRSSPIKNTKDNIMHWFGTVTDIDDRKRAENNLRYLAKASKVLSSSLDVKTTLDNIAKLAVPEIADCCSVDILNEKGGLEQVAIVHKNPKKLKWAKILREKYPHDMNAPYGLPKVIRTGKAEFYPSIPDTLLLKVARDKQHHKLLRNIGCTSSIIVPLFRKGKCVGGITFSIHDSTWQYTESDVKMAQELAARASLALDNAWLYKGSQDAITLRDNFISVASHELKTPVTSVKIFTQILQQHVEQIGDKKAKKHLEKMYKQLNKLTELIYDLLNVSKIQAGRMEFKQKLFDFDESVKEMIWILQEGETKHKLIIHGKTNKKVYADEDRIGQVLSNLIANAIKYSPDADKVFVHLSSDEKNVYVCVEDFGIGMAREHMGKIFERFYRVFDTTDKTFPGLGIGLYISSEIVRRHHGKLWVESDIGKGSRFYFSLPLNRDKKPNRR